MSARPPGRIRTVVGTVPAPGTEITETVPVGRRWRLLTLAFLFLTSATVASRSIRVFMDDGTNVFYSTPTTPSQAASLLRSFHHGITIPTETAFDSLGVLRVSLPDEIYFEAGYRFRTTTANLQAGDAYSNLIYEIEEWFTPP